MRHTMWPKINKKAHMKRSNKTFTHFILQSLQKPTTFVGHSPTIMQNKQLHTTSAFKASICCCCICCMP